jgi:hypothetical protein
VKSISKQLQKVAGKLILISAGNSGDFRDIKKWKRDDWKAKENENLIVHCVVNTNVVRNEEITMNEKEHDWKLLFASNDLNFDVEKNAVPLQKTE